MARRLAQICGLDMSSQAVEEKGAGASHQIAIIVIHSSIMRKRERTGHVIEPHPVWSLRLCYPWKSSASDGQNVPLLPSVGDPYASSRPA